MITNEMNWKLIRTRPKTENKVCELLTRKNIEHFCPANTTQLHKQQGAARRYKQPLFQQLVFVRVEDGAENLVQQVDGVLHFVYWLGKFVQICTSDIEMLRHYTSKHINVIVEKIEVSAAKRATMVYTKEDIEEGGTPKELCRMYLPCLGYTLVADVATSSVEVLNVRRPEKYSFASLFTGSFR